MAYKNNENTEDKTKELLEKLENGIKETLNSERYRTFLKFQSQFHSYSFNNQMLIYLQRPDATQVAGFKAWEKFERHVMKGEKGISILAPNPYKYQKEVDKIDPKTKEPIKDPVTGEVQKEKVEMQGKSFRKVTVFDVKQTDGKELPSICNELQGNSVNAESIIRAIKKVSEVPIVEKVIESGAKGYYSRLEDLIAINKGMSLDQTAKTLIHEYAHSQLHNKEAAALMDRATKEVQAESVAYIVSNRFGVDTSEYSFDYLANWSSGKELKELKQSFDLIQKTADNIINKIEGVLSKELELQNSPVKISIVWSESADLQKGQTFDFNEASKIFEKLDNEQSEKRKANDQYDYSKATAGENLPYEPYFKTKFEVELSDGTKREASFDLGDSGYKSLAECIQKECHIDVEKYIKDHVKETIVIVDNEPLPYSFTKQDIIPKEIQSEAKADTQSIRGKIIDLYSPDYPSIKHITESTAHTINKLNEHHGHKLTIKEIKALHNEIGKRLESGANKDDLHEFKTLTEVVDDLKHSKLVEKQVQAHKNSMENQLSKSNAMEMVQ
jgi:antirestriction protein ArdC